MERKQTMGWGMERETEARKAWLQLVGSEANEISRVVGSFILPIKENAKTLRHVLMAKPLPVKMGDTNFY